MIDNIYHYMNMDVDLDISHYDLESLVNLFKIPIHFTEEHLKHAKKIVLATHPDKSRLDKEYFLFFSKAYKILYQIHQFKCKSTKRNVQEYSELKYSDTREDNEFDKQHTIDILSKSNDFVKTFNSLFEKHYVDNTHGYGDWLSSQEDIHNVSQQDFDSLKDQTRNIVLRQEIEGVSSYTGDILGADIVDNGYSTNQYEDLKTAYTNGLVLGVDERDYTPGYSSLDQLKQDRYKQNVDPLTREEAYKQLESNNDNDNTINTARAYKLINEQEKYKTINQEVWSSLLRISHNK